jgi:hypothetical protein
VQLQAFCITFVEEETDHEKIATKESHYHNLTDLGRQSSRDGDP